MRVALVVLAALVLAPAAFAHAEISPTTAKADEATLLHLTVPTESATAATVGVRVTAPAGLQLSGTTTWSGRTRGVVELTFGARAAKGGDYALRVKQTYSDGSVVDWSGPESSNTPAPVLHVQGASHNSSDRIVIAIVIAAIMGAWIALGRRSKRS
ncbi:MAG TPA: DUF1775 domain-containing protein [Gaiellaceae bacterium]|nr:DUF1775 domain-containing protein [Gaiellaceae bacterium]